MFHEKIAELILSSGWLSNLTHVNRIITYEASNLQAGRATRSCRLMSLPGIKGNKLTDDELHRGTYRRVQRIIRRLNPKRV